MYLRSLVARRLTLVFAALQLVLPGAVSIADGMLELESARTVSVHIEEHSSPHCPRVHTEDCILCRTLSTGARPVPTATPCVVAARAAGAWAQVEISARRVDTRRQPPSRAPPATVLGLA